MGHIVTGVLRISVPAVPMMMPMTMSVATVIVLAIQFHEINDKQRSAWLEEIDQSLRHIFDGREVVI